MQLITIHELNDDDETCNSLLWNDDDEHATHYYAMGVLLLNTFCIRSVQSCPEISRTTAHTQRMLWRRKINLNYEFKLSYNLNLFAKLIKLDLIN